MQLADEAASVRTDERAVWTKSESQAQELAARHPRLVIVDLDETLYLRNSTEQFIALAAPGFLAALALRILDYVMPWRIWGGAECKDNWRVGLIICLFPWTIARWRRFCRTEAAKHVNAPLRDALARRGGPVMIASNGYWRIITPLLDALDLPTKTGLICCRLQRFSDRRDGKLELVRKHLDDEEIAGSAVITDAMKDAPILERCAAPCLTVWEEARFEKAFKTAIYVPGDYLSRAKRPRQSALKALVKEDLVFWVLAGLTFSSSVQSVVGLILLFFSMWSFYEIGYWDNDRSADKYEKHGKVSEGYYAYGPWFGLKAGITGLLLGALAAYCLAPEAWMSAFGVWVVAMAALCGLYWAYNRIDKNSRVWLYLPLQVFRFASLFVIVAATPAAVILSGSQIISRWIDYSIYRHISNTNPTASFPKRSQKTVRLTLYLLLMAAILLMGHWEALWTPALLGFPLYVYAAVRWEGLKLVRGFRWIGR